MSDSKSDRLADTPIIYATRWVNVYEDAKIGIMMFRSRAEADKAAGMARSIKRIACVKIPVLVEEGQFDE